MLRGTCMGKHLVIQFLEKNENVPLDSKELLQVQDNVVKINIVGCEDVDSLLKKLFVRYGDAIYLSKNDMQGIMGLNIGATKVQIGRKIKNDDPTTKITLLGYGEGVNTCLKAEEKLKANPLMSYVPLNVIAWNKSDTIKKVEELMAALLFLKKSGCSDTDKEVVDLEEKLIDYLIITPKPKVVFSEQFKNEFEARFFYYDKEAERRRLGRHKLGKKFNYEVKENPERANRKKLLEFADHIYEQLDLIDEKPKNLTEIMTQLVDTSNSNNPYLRHLTNANNIDEYYDSLKLVHKKIVGIANLVSLNQRKTVKILSLINQEMTKFIDKFDFLANEKVNANEEIPRSALVDFVEKMQKDWKSFPEKNGNTELNKKIQEFSFKDVYSLDEAYKKLFGLYQQGIEWLQKPENKKSPHFEPVIRLKNTICQFIRDQNNSVSVKYEEEIIKSFEFDPDQPPIIHSNSIPSYNPLWMEAARRQNEVFNYKTAENNEESIEKRKEHKAVIDLTDKLKYQWAKKGKNAALFNRMANEDTKNLDLAIENLGIRVTTAEQYLTQLKNLYIQAQDWLIKRDKDGTKSKRRVHVAALAQEIYQFFDEKASQIMEKNPAIEPFKEMQAKRAEYDLKTIAQLWKTNSKAISWRRSDEIKNLDKVFEKFNENLNGGGVSQEKLTLKLASESMLKTALDNWILAKANSGSKKCVDLVKNFSSFFGEKKEGNTYPNKNRTNLIDPSEPKLTF